MLDYLLRLAKRLMGRPEPPSDDPYAAVRQPRRRSPGGRNSAVALDEPRERTQVRAVGVAKRQG